MNGPMTLPDALLTEWGFNLAGVLSVQDNAVLLPSAASAFEQVLILGNGGPDLWEKLPEMTGEHPIDDYALETIASWLSELGVAHYQMLFPGTDHFVDLRGLGRALGWHHDSPLGTGIHSTYGSWFGYRLAVAMPAVFELTVPSQQTSPCDTCVDKPCIAACPVGATGEVFNLTACGEERLREQDCAYQCLARNACPVGAGYRYGETQMRYHYQHSLQTLRLIHSS